MSWRNYLTIHPACELFPPMSPAVVLTAVQRESGPEVIVIYACDRKASMRGVREIIRAEGRKPYHDPMDVGRFENLLAPEAAVH